MQQDLNNQSNREILEKRLDIDNYLLYMAIQTLSNNTDWPFNNAEFWYYDSTDNSALDSENSKYADGKIRFLLYDMDGTLWTKEETPFKKANVFSDIMDDETSLKLVLQSKLYRDKFITIISDLQNTSFQIDSLKKIIDEEFAKIKKETGIRLAESDYNVIAKNVENTKNNLPELHNQFINQIESRFNVHNKYNFSIKVNKGGKASWNNMEIYGGGLTYTNNYYTNVEFTMNYEPYPGYQFDYWLVNGNKIYDEKLLINDSLVNNNKIDIELFSKQDHKVSLIISEINARDDSDWIKLINVSKDTINLNNFYISDNENKLLKYQLPDITLKSNESIIINGNKNYFSMGDYICNFNLSSYETLFLYNSSSKEIVDKLLVPKMGSSETYGRYLNSNTFYFFSNKDNIRKFSTF